LSAPEFPAALAKLEATRRLAPVTSIATESHSRLCMFLLSVNSSQGCPDPERASPRPQHETPFGEFG